MKLKLLIAATFIIVVAAAIFILADLCPRCGNGPVKHQQFTAGEHLPGQIPDSTITDSNDNTIYLFKPIK